MTWTSFVAALVGGCGRVAFDASGGDAGDAMPEVQALGGLVDDFEDGTTAAFWDPYSDAGGSTFAEAGGELAITYAVGVNDSYAGYVTGVGRDFRGTGIWVELAAVPTGPDGANCYFTIDDLSGALSIGFELDATMLDVLDQNGNAVGTFAHDLATRRWLRIREAAGTLYFDASPDGSAWTLLSTQAAPGYVTDAYANIGGGTYQLTASSGTCRFASFNRTP